MLSIETRTTTQEVIMAMPNCVCPVCGKPFFRHPCLLKVTPIPCCSRPCRKVYGFKSGKDHQNWKGGRQVSDKGYMMVYDPKHHRAHVSGYVFEHIIVLEEKLGRRLEPNEHTHHLNEDRLDNRPENLGVRLLKADKGTHIEEHLDEMIGARKTLKQRKPKAKLTPELVLEIREMRASGMTHQAIADEIKVVKVGAVGTVLRGECWNDIENNVSLRVNVEKGT